jgi:predicted nucleotidyltransferase
MCTQSVLNVITGKIVDEMKSKLTNKLDKVILFGSYARGDYDDQSDIDIMVLANVSSEDANRLDMELGKIAHRLGLEHDILVSLIIKDCETFYKYLPAEPFYQNVMREGVQLVA